MHLEQHGVAAAHRARRASSDVGRERQRRMRHRQQRLRVARRVGLAERELRRERERGGPLQAGLDAERARRGVGADDVVRIDEGDRRRRSAVAAASVAAKVSSDSNGRCRAIQSRRSAKEDARRVIAEDAEATQAKSTKVAA